MYRPREGKRRTSGLASSRALGFVVQCSEQRPYFNMEASTLRIGSSGEAVRELQMDLSALGYGLGSAGVDGVYGVSTSTAVESFQQDAGISVDGIFGPETAGALCQRLTGSDTGGGSGGSDSSGVFTAANIGYAAAGVTAAGLVLYAINKN